MIVCRKCSRRHPDGTEFCDCGAYLAFDGEHVAEPAATTRSAEPPPAATPAWGAGESAGRVETTRRAEPPPWSGLPGESTWAGPGAPVAAPSSSVDARLPDVTRHDVGEPVLFTPSARDGDLPCPRCNSYNNPDRQFCQHCGQALAAGALAPTDADAARRALPWWKRLGRSARARAERVDANALATGGRRLASPRGVTGRVMAFHAAGITVVLAGLLAFLGPPQQWALRSARTLLGGKQYVAQGTKVTPTSGAVPGVTAQGIDQEVPANVLDRFSNTTWATRLLVSIPGAPATPVPATSPPATPGACDKPSGTDSYLHFEFDQPTDIDRIQILPGRYEADTTRKQYSRPRTMAVHIGDRCWPISVKDKGELQAFTLEADDVKTLELWVIDAYTEGSSKGTVEIAEVVFERQR